MINHAKPSDQTAVRRTTIVGLEASCLGFGCASLGSRVSASAGLAALDRAFAAGVTWYDVAPAYGGGEAEAILGRFVHGKRSSIRIVTKVGRAHRPRGQLYKLALPVARLAKGLIHSLPAGGMRSANISVPLDRNTIMRSLDASLRQLGTDHVDVFALHMPPVAALERDDIARALEEVVSSGRALRIAVAGDGAAAMAAARLLPDVLIQIEDDPLGPMLPRLRQAGAMNFVTHSVFGRDAMLGRLEARLRADAAKVVLLRDAGYDGELRPAIARLLLRRAFESNPDGVVLTSMYDPAHLAFNTACAAETVTSGAADVVRSLLARDI